MVFVGFGFLVAFLQRYGFSSVGFTFLLAALTLQWSTLVQGFLHSTHGGRIRVGVQRWAVAGSRLLPGPGLAGRPRPGGESQPQPCPSVGSQTCGCCPRGLPAPPPARLPAHPAIPGPFFKPLLTQGLLARGQLPGKGWGSGARLVQDLVVLPLVGFALHVPEPPGDDFPRPREGATGALPAHPGRCSLPPALTRASGATLARPSRPSVPYPQHGQRGLLCGGCAHLLRRRPGQDWACSAAAPGPAGDRAVRGQ